MDMTRIYTQLFQSSLHAFQQKNSSYPQELVTKMNTLEAATHQGGIFAVRDKHDFAHPNGVKGMIFTSIEALVKHRAQLSHFTPNPFTQFHYRDQKRQLITGFSEDNLLQINTFVVDIDTKEHSLQAILLESMDQSIGVPTLVVESTRGYQLYFMLEKPFFLSSKNKQYSLRIAKRISENLKRSLQTVDADLYCNDFGFFRLPTEQNIVSCQLDTVYSVQQFIDFSSRIDDNHDRLLFKQASSTSTGVWKNSDWFQAIIQNPSILGAKGQMGRNNAMFTIALACYQDGDRYDQTFDLLDEWNSSLHKPLKNAEVRRICQSAYSGKYTGPQLDYIQQLLDTYHHEPITIQRKTGWYKHKKERKDRVRSHIKEWECDICSFLTQKGTKENPFVTLSQTELCSELGIAKSTLNKLLNETSQIIRIVEGVGRNAKTKFTTKDLFIHYLIKQWIAKQKENPYYAFLFDERTMISNYHMSLYNQISSLLQRRRRHDTLLVHSA
ncbi:primase C-terminal domain-containing protein [Kurthia senegalensis]|uniref:primase C-terminal domain-containing protein n=1 Tax=Kurthia senegalensis TaxID=1033740 RepID=UPI000288448A|nr:primase C-terminal domain-containing protein [Kurthia senegalensis]